MSNDLKQVLSAVLTAAILVLAVLACYAVVKSLNTERAANAAAADCYSHGMPGTDRGC